MSIAPLPESTVRLLGSTQVLTTPTSLVKELIDNAIDANATSIDIIISPNTLDKIELRDNGHGIQREDFDSLGKRGHTSKLRSFEDLKSIGGTSLGFRGEALFSAIQLGKVTITSKCEGEQIATMAKFKVMGGIESKVTTSHPIGTTVSIADFLSSMPVRKQTSIKDAVKTIANIKELLRAYSLARVHIRFCLKILKGGKGNWSFSPRPNDGIKEAVSQIIGREVASQCMKKSLLFLDTEDLSLEESNVVDNVPLDENRFFLDMFLPKQDADFSKISYGQYLSVDGRPVSHEKGTMKKIVAIFKRHIRNCLPETSLKSSQLFLRLDIKCPRESYDPNVEPAKNDVIFTHESVLLGNIEKAFQNIYDGSKSSPNLPQNTDPSNRDRSKLLLSRNVSKVPLDSYADPVESSALQDTPTVTSRPSKAGEIPDIALSSPKRDVLRKQVERKISRASSIETPSPRAPSRTLISAEILEQLNQSPSENHLNPWLIAKMISPIQTKDRKLRSGRKSPTLSRCNSPSFTSSAELIQQQGPKDLPIPLSLARHSKSNDSNEDLMPTEECTTIHRHGFVSAKDVISQPLQNSDPTTYTNQKVRANKLPRTPPKLDTTPTNKKMRQATLNSAVLSSRGSPGSGSDIMVNNNNDLRLSFAIDCENRNEKATTRPGENIGIVQQVEKPGHDYDLRKQMARTHPKIAEADEPSLSQDTDAHITAHPTPETSLPESDPRGYFIRQLGHFGPRIDSTKGPKISRPKSSRLPLERIPIGQELHQCMVKVATSPRNLQEIYNQFEAVDEYIQKGSRACVTATENDDLSRISTKLKHELTRRAYSMLETFPHRPLEVASRALCDDSRES
ncbi:DNA mismatch repair protein/mutL [Blumeria hordei DH14]|uniref:DNA mismatch repair protein/mutL n=1 Tax=Blumeria graminis f. sp. hordei (strain DH14) TaxID=546991 RepID=N1JJE0_BLUG1|nr:DNA mismatch repair protein/mutL [Blumeria hordei DH14]